MRQKDLMLVHPDALEPDPKNPRRNEGAVAEVAESIRRFGFGAPIVARRTGSGRGVIIAGHTRWKAARALGLQEVPVRFMDLTEQEARALMLADNKLGEIAEWDDDMLREVISELGSQDFDLSGLGWPDDDLRDLIGFTISDAPESTSGGGDVGGGGDDDQIPEVAPKSKVGDVHVIDRHALHCGDCIDVMRSLDDDSVDAIVTDPPYGLSDPPDILDVLRHWMAGEEYEHRRSGFMGADWDSFVPGPHVWSEALRVCKPGAHGIVFAGTRTVDLMGIALRLAGWEVRDVIHWCYWSGFPKSVDVSKAIDDGFGHMRADRVAGYAGNKVLDPSNHVISRGTPVSDAARQWEGWGTGLKPAIEPAILIRKPLREGATFRQVLATGTGAINIDGCRFAPGDPMWPGPNDGTDARFPANLIYCPKPSNAEKEDGTDGLDARSMGVPAGPGGWASDGKRERRNVHPTVKPVNLMRWLVRLVTPPGGVILEPFAGSGTTLVAAEREGFRSIGSEKDPRFCDIAEARIRHAVKRGD